MFLRLSTRGLWLTWPTSSGMEGSGSLACSAALPTFCRWIRPLTDWIRRKRSSFVNPPLLGAPLFSSSRHLIRWPTSEMPVRTLRDYIALPIYLCHLPIGADELSGHFFLLIGLRGRGGGYWCDSRSCAVRNLSEKYEKGKKSQQQ